MTDGEEAARRLAAWLALRIPDAESVVARPQGAVDVGHSAETLLFTLSWDVGPVGHRREVVLRLRPPAPGLLEPYDLGRQFRILRALEPTPVRAPRALWHEPTGDVLGREFYVMERLPGDVYERVVPDHIAADGALVRRMALGLVEQLAAIHAVDLDATGLRAVADGTTYLDRELDHWEGEVLRVRKGPLPALERLAAELRSRRPPPHGLVTLVHGDAKPGNDAFVDGEVTAVFDWELATIGDPLADLGWFEATAAMPGVVTSLPSSPTRDELVAHYAELTGFELGDRPWYRALGLWKMAVIMLVAGMLYDRGLTHDRRLAQMGHGVSFITRMALDELGITEPIDDGPVAPEPRSRRNPDDTPRGT